MSTVASVYLLNLILVLVLARNVLARRVKGHGLLRAWLLSLFLLIDGCYILWVAPSMTTVVYLVVLVAICSMFLPAESMEPLDRSLGRGRFATYLLSVFTIASLAHIHLPITTFLTSPGEIGIHIDRLLTTSTTHTMVVVYLAAGLYAVAAYSRMRTALTVIAFGSLLVTLLYAYILPFGYPQMNGLMFEQIPLPRSELALRTLVDVFAIAAAAMGAVWLLGRYGSGVALRAVVLCNLSLAFASVYSFSKSTTRYEAEIEGAHEGTPLLTFGKEHKNVLVIFLDRFMGGFVEEILEQEPGLAARLEGFTWYPRTVASGENSIAGVHPILGGYDYIPREMNARKGVLRDLSVEAYSILPRNFTRHGYAFNFVNPRGLGFTMKGDCSFLEMEGVNCTHIPSSVSMRMAEQRGIALNQLAESSYTELLTLLGTMRSAPYLAKDVLSERGPWEPFMGHTAGTTFREWAELKSLSLLSSADSNKDNFNIVFNILPHEPYFMGEDCQPRETPLDIPEEEAKRRGHASTFALQHAVTARCALLLVGDYLQWMKDAGVYDNTKIVIVSDHGIVGPVTDRSSRAVQGDSMGNFFVRSRSVLLVKERTSRAPLQVSEAFMPNAEVPRIVCQEIGGCVNPYLGDKPIATDGRNDPHDVDLVPWQFNEQDPDGFRVLRRLRLVGKDPYDRRGWREVAAD